MSKLTKLVRGGFTEDCDYTGDPALVQDLCMVHEILEAEHEKLREENARLQAMLVAGNELTNKACALLSQLTGEQWPPKPPEVEDDEDARRLDQADMPGGFP